MILAAQAFAQTSPTGTATSTVFTTDVEDSMNVLGFSKVKFDNWAGFLGCDATRSISLGYATHLGDLYLGTWYYGNIAATNQSGFQEVSTIYDLTTQIPTQTTTRTSYTNQYVSSNNQLHALLGVGSMGFRVGFLENLTVYKNPDTTVTTIEDISGMTTQHQNEVADYSRLTGTLTPSLVWGMTLTADDIVIRPKVTVDFEIYRDYEILNTKPNYTTYNGVFIGNEALTYRGKSQNYVSPFITLGADFRFPGKKENSKIIAGIFYELDLEIYSNDYDVANFSDTVKGQITDYNGSSTTTKSMAYDTIMENAIINITDRSASTHTIRPTLYYDRQIVDGLMIGLKAALPIRIGVTSISDSYTKVFSTTKDIYHDASNVYLNNTTNVETIGSPGITDTTTFGLSPVLNIGATYKWVPNRLTINAGIGLAPFAWTHTTNKASRASTHSTRTTTVLDSRGNVVSKNVELVSNPTTDTVTDRETVSNVWGALTVNAALGFKLNFNENMAIDMAAGGGSSSDTFTLNLANVRAMFTLKF